MGTIESQIETVPGADFVGQAVLLGSLLGTAVALRAYRLGFRLEGWAIIGRWTVVVAGLALILQLLSEVA